MKQDSVNEFLNALKTLKGNGVELHVEKLLKRQASISVSRFIALSGEECKMTMKDVNPLLTFSERYEDESIREII